MSSDKSGFPAKLVRKTIFGSQNIWISELLIRDYGPFKKSMFLNEIFEKIWKFYNSAFLTIGIKCKENLI